MKTTFKGLLTVLALLVAAGCGSGSAGSFLGDGDGDADGCLCPNGCAEDGSCIETPCTLDSDCPAGQVCEQGQCNTPGAPTDGDADGDGTTDGDGTITDGDGTPDGDGVADGDGSEYEYDIEFETDIPHEEGDPWITVDTRRLDFGAVPLHSSRTKSVKVTNIGAGDLEIDDIYIYFDQTPEELAVNNPALPVVLVKDGSMTIEVEFVPTDLQPDFNMLVIHSNDPAEPNVGVEIVTDIKETVAATIEPASIEFGVVRLGNYSQTVTIANDSGVELAVSGILLDAQSPEIGLDGAPGDIDATNPLIIERRESFSFDVWYRPTVADGIEDTAGLRIETNDENLGTVIVPVSGTPCEPEIEAAPTVIDFTDVEFGSQATRCTTITNLGCWDLDIASLTLTDDGDGAYALDPAPTAPTTLGGEESLEVCAVFTPQSTGDGTGLIAVESSDANESPLEILLASTVLPSDIDCAPIPLDFGRVPLSTEKILSVVCKNLSPGQLQITRYSIDRNPDGRYTLLNMPAAVLEYNESTTFDVRYYSDVEGLDEGNLFIQTNDPDELKVDVPLVAECYNPNHCPTASIAITAPTGAIYRGDTVHLDGTGSSDPDAGDSIDRYIWTVQARPSGSTSQIVNPNDPQPTFVADKAGDYTIKLQVKDTVGEFSCEAATISFTAQVPPPDIECMPAAIDFGSVALNTAKIETLACRNVGGTDLTVSQYELTPSGGPFSIYGSPATVLAAGQTAYINLRYRPTTEGSDSALFRVHSNDPDEPIVETPLSGGGYFQNECPTASARVVSPPLGNIKQFDTVQLDGSASYDLDAGDQITHYIWAVQSAPAGSTSQVTPADAALPSFYVDKPGTYVIQLQVKDKFNALSCNTATVSFTAVAPADIECGPSPLVFAPILAGSSRTENVLCRNVGGLPLTIGGLSLLGGSDPSFNLGGAPTPPITVGLFATAIIPVAYAPAAPGSHAGTLRIASDDPDEATIDIPLSGSAFPPNNCPIADLTVTSPNLAYLKPLDTVQLDGTGSYDPDAGDSISTYIWTVTQRPGGSTSQINAQGQARPTFWVDLAGTYTITLQVKDRAGLISCNTDSVVLEAIPREKIHVQLVWNTDETDIDLHLVRPGGQLWSSGACYFSNCTNGLDWGQYGEPSLDIDKRYGYGPENINLDDPSNGAYTVYAHYWDNHGVTGPTVATVRIYIWGQLRGEWQNTFAYADLHKRWPVATIVWSADDATVNFLGYTIESDGHGDRRRIAGGPTKPPLEK